MAKVDVLGKNTRREAIPATCKLCGGVGFTGSPESLVGAGEYFIGLAAKLGTPCSCPSGVEFDSFQKQWAA